MNLKTAMQRARRGLREDLKLYLVAVSSLTVAFLCLAGALLVLTNLDTMADQWGSSRRVTIYLVDGAEADDVEQLTVLLESLPEASSVEHVSSAAARAQFLEQTQLGAELGSLPADAFPASLEVNLVEGASMVRIDDIASRVARFGAVDDVETYSGWFGNLEALLDAGRGLSLALALLVMICVLAVVGNTIRLAVAGRREEIEVMKLCGATDRFVRSPFVVEGAFQGFAASFLAVLLLFAGFLVLQGRLDASLTTITGVHTTFLQPWIVLSILVSGTLVGALGSAVSLRRYLAV